MSLEHANWRRALAGEKQPIYEEEPWCGYFRVQDRSGLTAVQKAGRWPWVPAAIWRDDAGRLHGERKGKPVLVGEIWPWAASHPITYEDYVFYHTHDKWPEPAKEPA